MSLNQKVIRSQLGQSLIVVLSSVALLSMIMAGFGAMMVVQHREARATAEKLAAASLESLLNAVWSDGAICSYILTDTSSTFHSSGAVTFNASSDNLISIKKIPISTSTTAGNIIEESTSPISSVPSLEIATIKLDIKPSYGSGHNIFAAQLEVTFNSSKLVRPINSIYLSTVLETSTSGASNKTVVGCHASTSRPVVYQCPIKYSTSCDTAAVCQSTCLGQMQLGETCHTRGDAAALNEVWPCERIGQLRPKGMVIPNGKAVYSCPVKFIANINDDPISDGCADIRNCQSRCVGQLTFSSQCSYSSNSTTCAWVGNVTTDGDQPLYECPYNTSTKATSSSTSSYQSTCVNQLQTNSKCYRPNTPAGLACTLQNYKLDSL